MKNIIIGLFIMFSIQSYANTDTLYANISATQAYDSILAYNNNPFFVILDVRTASEYVSHIEGGVNIDFYNPNFSLILDSLNKCKIYLIHCQSGGRSAQVYTMMQTKHFKTVYNMLGGINAWNSASFPTTSIVAPKLGLLTDSVNFFNTNIGSIDSILVTLTNCKNSILNISSSTSLLGTEFSSSFNNINLYGARDYSFYIYYQPTDLINDSIIVLIESNGGNKTLYIKGNALPTNIKLIEINNDIIISKSDNYINLRTNSNDIISNICLYDINGKKLIDKTNNETIVNCYIKNIKSGIYILHIVTSNNIHFTRKIFL